MYKKYWRKYGATIIIAVTLISVFFIGFIFGMYGRSAPSLMAIEKERYKAEAATNETPAEAEKETAAETPALKSGGIYKVTAYCPCKACSDDYGRATATGATAKAGRTIAVDPSVIPYGTEVIINGNTYIAEDCGAAVKGKIIDIFFNTHEEANNFGAQKIEVFFKS